MPEGFQYRRAPARPRRIADINPEEDIRVRLVGHVVSRSENSIMLDDKSSTREIIFDGVEIPESEIVRIFARVLPLEDGYELRAEIVQSLDSLDMELYKKVMKKVGKL